MWSYHFDQDKAFEALNAFCLASRSLDKRYICLQAPPRYGKSHLLQYFVLTFPFIGVKRRELPRQLYRALSSVLEEEDIFVSRERLLAHMFQTQPLRGLRRKVKQFNTIEDGVAQTLKLLLDYSLSGKSSLLYFLEELQIRHEGTDRAQELRKIYQQLLPYLRGGEIGPIIDEEGEDEQGNVWRKLYVDLSKRSIQDVFGKFGNDAEEAADALNEQIRSRNASLLLCLDALERLQTSEEEWTRTFLTELDQRTRRRKEGRDEEELTIRIILAGRRLKSFWREYRRLASEKNEFIIPSGREIFLEPFDKEAMLLAVKQGEELDAKIEWLYHCSGGYPGVASEILRMLREDVSLDWEVFVQRIDELTRDAVGAFFEEMGDLAGILQVLSVFRIWDLGLLIWLQERGYLGHRFVGKDDLWRELTNKDLIKFDQGVSRPNIPRQIVVHRLQLIDRQRFMHLHGVARVFYEKSIKSVSRDTFSNQQGVVEWLYHTLQERSTMSYSDLVSQMYDYMRLISTADMSVFPKVEKMVNDDAEIAFLFKQQYGFDKWEKFKEEVFHGDL